MRVCVCIGLYQWGQGSCSWPPGNSQHNLVWTWRQEAATAKLEVSAGDLLTLRGRDLSTLSSLYHTQANLHTCSETEHTSTHTHKNIHEPHTGTHSQATAEWSQLERQRHFGLSTARISGQVRTTHTDARYHTQRHTLSHWSRATAYTTHFTNTWKPLSYGVCVLFVVLHHQIKSNNR